MPLARSPRLERFIYRGEFLGGGPIGLSLNGIKDDRGLGCFQNGDGVFAPNIWKMRQKFVKRVASFQIVEQVFSQQVRFLICGWMLLAIS